MEGTSDYDLAMEWYLKYGEREILETTRRNDYPQGSFFYTAGVANSNNHADIDCRTWKITTKALKVIREHNGTNS